MNQSAPVSDRIPRPPKGCIWGIIGAVLLFVLWSLYPTFIWTGAAWLTIEVRTIDAGTHQPITNAIVTLLPDPAPVTERLSSPTILSAQTDNSGRAVLKHQFGAGGGTHNTTMAVRSSRARCEAPGYRRVEVLVAEAGKLRFRDFPFLAPRNHKTELTVQLVGDE